MATYKLIQDIEAEDHILGPLTLRQFIFALIAAFCFYICFISVAKHLLLLLVFFLPPGLFCLFFAIPFGRDQPTEIWALAKLRFLVKPRRRTWDQSGIKELVTITVPKKVERVLTNGLSQTEVQSRLKALSNTLDSRGWAVKHASVNSFAYPDPLMSVPSDRLVNINNAPLEVPNYDVQPQDDMLDVVSNPIAQQFDHMIGEAEAAHRQQLINSLQAPAPLAAVATVQAPAAAASPTLGSLMNATPPQPPADYWFMQPPAASGAQAQQAPPQPADPTADEQAMMDQLKSLSAARGSSYGRLRTLQPLDNVAPRASTPPPQIAPPPLTPPQDPAIISLASNNDLNVATLAREAHKAKRANKSTRDEVVISLH